MIFGAIPSSIDNRDYHVSSLISTPIMTFPKYYKRNYSGKIKDQGNVGSCVAHSIAYCREIKEEMETGQYKEFSVGFIYANRRLTDHQTPGMSPRQALANLKAYGSVLNKDFPYNMEYPDIRKRLDYQKLLLLDKAAPYRITTYARVYTLEDYKSALMRLGPVSVMIPIFNSFYSVSGSGIVPVPDAAKEKLLGYHQVTGLGWDELDNKIILNSWGQDWGDNGYCYLPRNYPITEMWSITDNIVLNKK